MEHEVKLRLDAPEPLRTRLVDLGAHARYPSLFERNDLYDSPGGELRRTGRLLRLRRLGTRHILTYKGEGIVSEGIRSRPESETEVADGARMAEILEGLGYVRTFRYEKFRESWELDRVEVVIDETPMGWFTELEGEPPRITEVAARLGLDATGFLGTSYARLWHEWRMSHPEARADMIFSTELLAGRNLEP